MKEPRAGDDRVTTEASTGSAGAQTREEGVAARQGTGGKGRRGSGTIGGSVQVNIRLRQVIVDAVAQAVRDSPIEFGNASDFYHRAIEHELARRGLLKTHK